LHLSFQSTRLECTSVKTNTGGNKAIECKQVKSFTPFLGVKAISASRAGDIMFRGVYAGIDLTAFAINNVFLDDTTAGTFVIADDSVVIQAKGVMIMTFNNIGGQGVIINPTPELPYLTTTFSTGCNNAWYLAVSGPCNIVVLADVGIGGPFKGTIYGNEDRDIIVHASSCVTAATSCLLSDLTLTIHLFLLSFFSIRCLAVWRCGPSIFLSPTDILTQAPCDDQL